MTIPIRSCHNHHKQSQGWILHQPKSRWSVLPNFGGDHHRWVGASGTSLTARSGPHTPLFQGPFRAPLRRLGAVCCAPSGPRQRRLRRAFRPQPAARTPATGWPLGPLAGACESQHEATAVAIGRPGHHRPGLCCVVVLSCCRVVDAGPKPTASAPARPLHPAAGARGHGPVARAGHVHPTTGRSTAALSPCPAPLQLRASDACGGPGPGAQRAPSQQQRLRHRERRGSRDCSDWSPGVGPSRCPATSMEGSPPVPFKKAGRAAGAIE